MQRPLNHMRTSVLVLIILCTLTSTTPVIAGTQVLTLPASNDGVPLRYGLFVPDDTQGKLPMIVDVAPTAEVELDVAKLAYYDLANARFIVLRLPPFGRGGLRWTPFGERDGLQVIRHVMAEHPVDADRVHLLGATQGFRGSGYGAKKLQYGTLNLAYHHPDLFAAVAIGAKDIHKDAYRGAWLGDWHQYQLQFAFPLRLREMPILWADNLLNTPTWVVVPGDGRKEIQLYHAMDKCNPVELKVLFAPGVKGTPLPDEVKKEQIAWLLTHRINRMPKRVVIATNTLKHSRNRWVRIDRLTRVNRFSRLEARLTTDGRLKVRGANFEGFTLTDLDKLAPGRRTIDVDIEHQVVRAKPAREVSFRRAGGKWEIGRAAVPPIAKTETMTDTVIDAFRESYILVAGSGDEAKLRQLARDTINAIQNGGLASPIDLSGIPVKLDKDVTPEDMKRANLILFGDERTNAIIAKINGRLPIRLDNGKIISGERTFSYPDQALMMVYPNPLAPSRKVVIVTGAIHKGYLLTDKTLAKAPFPKNLPAHGFPMLGDWIVFRENGKGVAKKGRRLEGLDNAVVEGGFFDETWKPMPGPYYFFNKNFAR